MRAVALLMLVACSTPKSAHEPRSGDVPANSLSEARLTDAGAPDARAEEPTVDPSQPYLQRIGETSDGGADKPKTGRVSKQECAQLFDRYLELSMEADERLQGLPAEIVAQAKEQARQQKGDPCQKQEIPRAKANCAMAAKTPKEWEKCMK